MHFAFVGTMIKLFKVKEKQRELAENASGKPQVKKQSAGELRLHKGILFFPFVVKAFKSISSLTILFHARYFSYFFLHAKLVNLDSIS